jgi:hypothetical protein
MKFRLFGVPSGAAIATARLYTYSRNSPDRVHAARLSKFQKTGCFFTSRADGAHAVAPDLFDGACAVAPDLLKSNHSRPTLL